MSIQEAARDTVVAGGTVLAAGTWIAGVVPWLTALAALTTIVYGWMRISKMIKNRNKED